MYETRLLQPKIFIWDTSLVHIFNKLNSYWFYIEVWNAYITTRLSGMMVLGSDWLDLFSLHSSSEVEIKYTISAYYECFLCSYFIRISTHTQRWMLKILVHSRCTPKHINWDSDIVLNLYHTYSSGLVCVRVNIIIVQ